LIVFLSAAVVGRGTPKFNWEDFITTHQKTGGY